jgi:ferric-dicitrate binding protein FerR (iron transport regulator)
MEVSMSIWQRFGDEIARTEDEMLAGGDRLERVRRRLLESASNAAAKSRWRAAGGRRMLALAAAAAAVVALGVAAAIVPWRDATALEATVDANRTALRAGEWVAAPAEAARRIDFSDGSSVSLEPRSGARVVALAADGARVSLERGTARVSVHKRQGARWLVDVGPYAVSVKGTRFVVAWDPESQLFTLSLEEGSVFVRGPLLAEGRAIAVHETLRASVAEGRLEIFRGGAEVATGAGTAVAAPGEARTSPEPANAANGAAATDPSCAEESAAARSSAPRREPAAAAEPESWSRLAASGDYADAVGAAERRGIDAVLSEATPAELLLLGDAARLSKRFDLADRSYLAIRARHPGGPESVSAAFALGRLAFDHQHLYVKAARWMDVYLAEGGADAPLAREALGRLMEALQRAGDLDGARNAAARYLARYPSGPHAEVAHRVLTQAGSGAASAP